MEIEQGIDTVQFKDFVKWLENNPEEATLELKASARYEGVPGRSLAKVNEFKLGDETIKRPTREYTYSFGAWKEVEEYAGFAGPTDRIEPVETALSSLAACINVAVSVNAMVEGIDLDDLKTTVKTRVDPSVLFGVQDVEEADACLKFVEADIEVEGEDLDEQDLEQIQKMVRRSPVHTLISSDHTIMTQVNEKE